MKHIRTSKRLARNQKKFHEPQLACAGPSGTVRAFSKNMSVLRGASVAFGWVIAGTFAVSGQDVQRIDIDFNFVEGKAREAAAKPFVRPRDERPLPEPLKK